MKRATAIGFATALSGARTVDEVDEVIRTGLPPVVEASGALLGIVDRDEGVLRLRLSELFTEEMAARYERIPIGAAGPFAEVISTREMVLIQGIDDWRAHAAPQVVDDAIAAGLATMVCVPLIDSSGQVVAALAVAWTEPVEVSDAQIATLRTVAELCEQTLERAHATDQATERATMLARLAERLADALSVEEALETVTASGPSPVGAIAASIGLVDEESGVLRTHHGQAVAEAIRERFVDPPLDAALAFTDAARLNEPVLVGDFEAYAARYPESADTVAAMGFGARAAMPVHTAGGRVIGSIIHAWAGPRIFDEAMVSTLATIAEMAGQAIERARLVEQIQEESARHEALASLAELLATARTSVQVAEVVAVHAAAVAGAGSANLALVDPLTGNLEVHHNPTLPTEVQERFRVVPPTSRVPHVDVVRNGRMLTFCDLDEFGAHYPHLLDELKAAGRQACAVVPLTTAGGERLGALGLAWNEPTDMGPAQRAVLVEVADLCAQAIERARLSDAEHHLVTTLQDSVLTPLPPADGLDMAARYLPAARHIGMGGDWYQGITLDVHRYAVIVGDVAGHGITAVGDMAQLKAVIGALVRIGTPLGEVFSETTKLLRSGGRGVTATALVAVIDSEAETITYAAAGHPPPLVLTAPGEVVELDGGRQPLLGVVAEAIDHTATQPFPIGSTLIVYTDGLVERRREPMDRSIDRLADALLNVEGHTSDDIASHVLVHSMVTDEPDDDVALIVVRRTA